MQKDLEFHPYLNPDQPSGGGLSKILHLPDGASRVNHSINFITDRHQSDAIKANVLSAEASAIQYAQQIGREYDALQEKEELSSGEALTLASIESAAYISRYPHLILHAMTFGNCYRLLRAAELMGEMKRGGDSLIIGAGETTAEALALSLKPPTDELVAEMMRRRVTPASLTLNAYGLSNLGMPEELPLLEGHVTAIEPNERFDELFERSSKLFPIPNDVLTRERLFLSEKLISEKELEQYDSILWYRADPQILGFNADTFLFDPNEAERQMQGMVLTHMLIQNLLKIEGTFGITVGTGNTASEKQERLAFMKITSDILKALPVERSRNLSGLYLTNLLTAGMFAEPYGSVAGLFATKKGSITHNTDL